MALAGVLMVVWGVPEGTLLTQLNATKGISQGEDIWLSVRQDFDRVAIGFNHFLVYFTARMYWGGEDQDMDLLFREYCRLFYGPAEQEMHAFFTYCEAHWQAMEREQEKVDAALSLFAAAQRQVAADSVYARRIELIDDYLKGLRARCGQPAQRRGPVPALRLVGQAPADIAVDGRLDDAAWEQCPVAASGSLRELQTGRRPTFGTSFKAAWRGGSLYFAIRCDERPGEKLNVATTRKEDPSLWYGDAVEILLETAQGRAIAGGAPIVLAVLPRSIGVEEFVVGPGGDSQLITRPHLFERVTHASGSDCQVGEVAFLVDLLDVDGDRLLDDHVLALRVGIPHPQVLPALLVDARDVADRQAGHIRARGEAEGDLPVLVSSSRSNARRPGWRTRRTNNGSGR